MSPNVSERVWDSLDPPPKVDFPSARHEHQSDSGARASDRASVPACPMSGLGRGTVYRGMEGCLPPKERTARPSGGGRRGGTVGPGSRQGKRRLAPQGARLPL